MKTIVLTGMMGCGKSTIGELLNKSLHCELVDIDSIVEREENETISEIFKTKGEDFFRNLEAKTIKNIFKKDNQIISLGGGAFENKTTREFLTQNAFVIYLKTSPEVIFERIKTDTKRPLLKNNMNIEKIKEILESREKNYKSAHLAILTDNKNPSEIIKEIMGALK